VDPQFKYDILMAMGFAYGFILLMRFWPRLQAKLMKVPFILPAALKARLDEGEDILILDVRMPHEYNGVLGHIEGSLNVEVSKLGGKIETLGDQLAPYKNERIVITCKNNNRSPKAARILNEYGFSKVSILDGGMIKWSKLKA